MLNKLFLAGAATMLLAASAFAQTPPTVTTTYATAPTITAGNCTITGATTFQYNPSTNTLVLQNATDSCNSNGGGGLKTASVNLSINPTTYTLGSNAAAPVISVTSNNADATITCTLSPTNGFTVTGSPVTNTGTFTLSTPTTQGTFSFTPSCTTSTTGYNTVVTAGTVSLTVNPASGGGGGACSASQTSTALNGVTLQRQCSGQVYMLPTTTSYNGPLTDLGTVLGNTTFPSYAYAGKSPTFVIQSGYYVSLAFTPQTTGTFNLAANVSYGDGGISSLSTVPGGLTRGAPGVICALSYNSSNNLIVSTLPTSCQVTVGQTYYVNFADTDINGTALCYGGAAGSCGTSLVSYTLYTSK